MKTDLNALMHTHHLDAILVTGPAQHNPEMYYFTGPAHLTNADLLIRRDGQDGGQPLLFCRSMERDEAAQTGLAIKNIDDYRFSDLLQESNGDFQQATILRYKKMLTDAGVTQGRVGLYGKRDAGEAVTIFGGLQDALPGLTFVGEFGASTLMEAMMTKDSAELDRMRQIGKITTAVVGQAADFLTSHRTQDEVLIRPDGSPLTIGDVKRQIQLWLAERGAENPEGVIFAQGYDSAVPHSSGADGDTLRLGQTIVFDIFPCEAGGGYFYDFTRTWCLGYAPDPALQLYEQVLSVYRQIIQELKLDEPCQTYQKQTCDLFEAMGHPTVQSNPHTQEGYVHSVGHGLGLHVHERPWSGMQATEADRMAAGVVFTVEPGLYYPSRNMGVRLEDSVTMHADGTVEVLAPYPMQLVLPMSK